MKLFFRHRTFHQSIFLICPVVTEEDLSLCQIQQLSQKSEQLEQQLQQVSKELQQANSKVEQLNQAKLQLEQQELMMKDKLEWYKAQTDREYRETMANEAKRRTEAEIAQLSDGNPYNDKIRQIGH